MRDYDENKFLKLEKLMNVARVTKKKINNYKWNCYKMNLLFLLTRLT